MSNGSSQQQQQHDVPADAPISAHPDGHRIPAFPFRLNTPSSTPPAAPESPVEAHPAPIPSIARVHPADLAPIVSHLELARHHMEAMYRAVCQMRDELAATHGHDFEETLLLGPNVSPTRVDYHARRHFLVWVPATGTSLVIQFDGIGAETRALNAGWTVLDPPSGAKISSTAAATIRVRYTNDVAPGLVG